MSAGKDTKGTVINIQHFCYNDGPGLRTVVFVKGCSLKCRWCGNPESISPVPQLAYEKRDCMGCDKCGLCLRSKFGKDYLERDDEGIVSLKEGAREFFDNESIKCCPAGALSVYGEEKTVAQVISEVDKDIPYYRGNGGGITVSGGEPLLQPEFTAELLKAAHAHGYSTAIETASNVPWENMAMVLPFVDTVLHDIKIFDTDRHRYFTGVDNKRILYNLKRAYKEFPNKTFIARTPIIHKVNDDDENIKATLDFILPYPNVVEYELLPYHKLGFGKYRALGQECPPDEFEAPSKERLEKLREVISEAFAYRDKINYLRGGNENECEGGQRAYKEA